MTLDAYFRAMLYSSQSIHMNLDEPPPFGLGQAYPDPIDGRDGPTEEMEQEELRCVIAVAIAALPENERVILFLYHDENS